MVEYEFIDDLKYTATHEWVRAEEDVAIIGITDFAQHQLSDVVYVEFPEIGNEYDKDAEACVLESAKAAADVILPISGEIIEINEALGDKPELINSSPFDEGWIMKIRMTNPGELDELLTVEEYKELISKELEE